MSKHFYNTISATPQLIFEFGATAKSLEDFILMSLTPGKSYSPYDVLELCEFLEFPTKENSVRRALTNLRKNLKIEYTGNRVVNKKYSPVSNATIRLKK